VQAIVRAGTGAAATPRLWVVTRGAQPVAGSAIEVGAVTGLGLGQVIAQETPRPALRSFGSGPGKPGE